MSVARPRHRRDFCDPVGGVQVHAHTRYMLDMG